MLNYKKKVKYLLTGKRCFFDTGKKSSCQKDSFIRKMKKDIYLSGHFILPTIVFFYEMACIKIYVIYICGGGY